MYFSYATKYTSSELKNYTIDSGNSSRKSRGSTQLLWLGTKSFFSFTVTDHVELASPPGGSYSGLWQFEAMPDDVLENCYLMTCFSLTLTSTISPSITIDIESCSVFIT